MQMSTILIVDDYADSRLFVRTSLESEGYKVVEVSDGNMALSFCDASDPDLIILDLMLGQPDGLEVCRQIRQKSSVPIIMLTSRSTEIDEAMSLAAGADDFLSKPVSGRILSLRVASQLRHTAYESADKESGSKHNETNILSWGSIEIDVKAREVRIDSKVIALTITEFEFLKVLVGSPKQVFTREQLAPVIGASSSFGLEHALDTHASRLRLKIRRAGGPDVVVSVRGVGYRLSAPK